MLSTTRIAVSGTIAATLTAVSTVAGVMLGHKYMDSRLGGGLLGFFVLSPITNAIAFPFHGPGAMAAMRQLREVQDSLNDAPLASRELQQGSGATPAGRYAAAVSERQNANAQPTPIRVPRGVNGQVA